MYVFMYVCMHVYMYVYTMYVCMSEHLGGYSGVEFESGWFPDSEFLHHRHRPAVSREKVSLLGCEHCQQACARIGKPFFRSRPLTVLRDIDTCMYVCMYI